MAKKPRQRRSRVSAAETLLYYERLAHEGRDSRTRHSYRQELLGGGLWWDAAAELAGHDAERLRKWISLPAEAPAWAIGILDGTDFRHDDHGEVLGVTARQALNVARLALEVRSPRPGAGPDRDLLSSMTEDWAAASVLPRGLPGGAFTRRRVPRPVRDVFVALDPLPGGQARAAVALQALLLSPMPRRERHRCSLHVLFTRRGPLGTEEGVSGVLEVAVLRDGPSGLFPDPRTMGLVQGDDGFVTALTAAWQHAVGDRRRGPCVLWRLKIDVGGPVRIAGGSLGAAFAVLLLEALGPAPRLRSGPVAVLTSAAWRVRRGLRGLVARRAITGVVRADGKLAEVEGLTQKLHAARRGDLQVVAPRDNQENAGSAVDGAEVEWAADVKEARKKLYRLVPHRIVIPIAVVMVALVAMGIIIPKVLADGRKEANAERVKRVAQELVKGSVSDAATDPPNAIRQALAAYRLEPSPANKANLVTSLARNRYAGDLRVQGELDVSPGGEFFTILRPDGRLTLWNGSTPYPAQVAALPDPAVAAAIAHDGRTLATSGKDGKLRLWDVRTPEHPVKKAESAASLNISRGLALSPDGRTLAGGEGAEVGFWDITDPVRPRRLGRTASAAPSAMAFEPIRSSRPAWATPEGRRPAGAPPGPSAVLPRTTRTIPEGGPVVYEVAFSPDGKLAAAAGSYVIPTLWDLSDRGHPRQVARVSKNEAFGIAFSPDGKLLGTSSGPGEKIAQLWDIKNPSKPRHVATLGEHTNNVLDVAFSKEGGRFVTAGDNGPSILWDIKDPGNPERIAQLQTPPSPSVPPEAAFSASGDRIYISTAEGVRIWRTNSPQEPVRLAELPVDYQKKAIFSPDDRTLLAYGFEEFSIWDISDRSHPVRLHISDLNPLSVNRAAISPDGRTLAMITMEVRRDNNFRFLELWDLRDRVHPKPIGQLSSFGLETGDSVAFSPDGRSLAASGENGVVKLFDVTDPWHPHEKRSLLPPDDISSTGTVDSLQYSPDGEQLVGVYDSNEAVAWNLRSDTWQGRLVPLPPVTRKVTSNGEPVTRPAVTGIAFDTKNGKIITATSEGSNTPVTLTRDGISSFIQGSASTISSDYGMMAVTGDQVTIVYDITDPIYPIPIVTYPADAADFNESLTFSHDNRTLSDTSTEFDVRLWDMSQAIAVTKDPVQAACTIIRTGFSREQWSSRIPLPYKETC